MKPSPTAAYNEEEDSSRGHVVFAVPLRDRTPLQSAVSKLRTWAPSSPPSVETPLPGSRPSNHHRRLSHPSTVGRELILPGVALERTPSGQSVGGPEHDGGDAAPGIEGDRVTWAAWDQLESANGETEPRTVLLMAYATSGLAVWDASILDSWYELLNVPSLDAALPGDIRSALGSGVGAIVGCSILPAPLVPFDSTDPWTESRPLLAILTTNESITEPRSHILFYSLKSHSFVHHSDVDGRAHAIVANRRFLVVSTSSPLTLHVLSTTTFDPAPFSPLIDLAPSPFDGAPVFSLGKGGRILAYATTRPVPVSRLERDAIVRPGAGLLAQQGMFDGDTHQNTSSHEPSHANGFMGDGRTAGQLGGEVARRVGEGVLSGVKAIGDLGFSYWASRSPPSPGEMNATHAGHNFSKSAPLPSVPGFERRSPPMTGRAFSRQSMTETNAAGTVIAVDLLSYSSSSASRSPRRRATRSPASPLTILAHFRPYQAPLAIVSLAPSSAYVLTASSHGQSFDIFELRPAVKVGVSSLGPDQRDAGKAWHRYRLQRGFTSARATTVTWTPDMRFIGVGTGKGTTHMYAVQPFGGKPNFENHFGAKVANTPELQPLSVTLSTIARIRPAVSQAERAESISPIPPSALVFLNKSHSLASSFSPPPPGASAPRSKPHNLTPTLSSTTFQDCIVFYPHSGSCTLERISSHIASATAESTLAAASRGDVGRLANTAVSGLSQLMNRGGQVTPQAQPEWIVTSSSKAEWTVARQAGWREVKENLDSLVQSVILSPQPTSSRFSAAAEIETFSRSPLVLPRSIYLCQQFDFYAFADRHSHKASRRLEVRSEVQLRQGSATGVPASPLIQPTSLDQPIRSAMQTILDSDAAFATGSPRLLTPTFPNGVAGRQGTWRDAIPIRAVAPSVNDGIGRVRREFHRVRVSAAVPRRSASSGAYSSSISFEDDDAVFADLIAHSESGSTACTSEQDGEISDDACWGLHEEPAVLEHLDIPFEDDFDDFSLDPPTVKVDRGTSTATLPVPILEDDSSSFGSSLDPSPTKESHLLDVTSPLSASPSSDLSTSPSSSRSRRKSRK